MDKMGSTVNISMLSGAAGLEGQLLQQLALCLDKPGWEGSYG